MPNINDAISAMEELEATVASPEESESTEADTPPGQPDGVEVAATEASEEVTEPEKKPEPDETALKRAELQERLEAAKAKSRAARDQAKFKAEREEFERSKQELTKFHDELRSHAAAITKAKTDFEAQQREFFTNLRKNPVATMRAAGIAPDVAYEAITNEMLKRQTPESKEEELLEKAYSKVRSEVEPKLSKVEELEKRLQQYEEREKQREQMEYSAARQSAESTFLNIVRQTGYEELADYYEDEQLVSLGDVVANEFVAAGHKFTLKDVADELTNRLRAHLKMGEERRAKRMAGSQSAAVQPAPATPPGNSAKKPATTAIGNDLASASATSAPATRPKSRKELLNEAAREISSADITSMFR